MHTGVPLPPNPMEELEKNLQQSGEQQLTKQEERKSEQRKRTIKKTVNISVIILIAGGGIFGLGWFLSTRPSLPPTSQQNHSEQSPPAHIVAQPISDGIQRHMLEHSDGGGAPGIIIQYNCGDFDCETDLVQKLTTLTEQYPDNVYLAPNKYDGKIILTKLGKREILDTFDEQAIKNFNNKRPAWSDRPKLN